MLRLTVILPFLFAMVVRIAAAQTQVAAVPFIQWQKFADPNEGSFRMEVRSATTAAPLRRPSDDRQPRAPQRGGLDRRQVQPDYGRRGAVQLPQGRRGDGSGSSRRRAPSLKGPDPESVQIRPLCNSQC
jgi:hypothetical protein